MFMSSVGQTSVAGRRRSTYYFIATDSQYSSSNLGNLSYIGFKSGDFSWVLPLLGAPTVLEQSPDKNAEGNLSISGIILPGLWSGNLANNKLGLIRTSDSTGSVDTSSINPLLNTLNLTSLGLNTDSLTNDKLGLIRTSDSTGSVDTSSINPLLNTLNLTSLGLNTDSLTNDTFSLILASNNTGFVDQEFDSKSEGILTLAGIDPSSPFTLPTPSTLPIVPVPTLPSGTVLYLPLALDLSDKSASNHSVISLSNVSYISGEKSRSSLPFYGSLNANSSCIYVDDVSNGDFNFGTGDFSIELYAYFNPGCPRCYLVDQDTNSCGYLVVNPSGSTIELYMPYPALSYTVNVSIASSTWHHFAITRQSGTVRLFLNGTMLDSRTNTNSLGSNTGKFQIGGINQSYGGGYALNGYIDSVLVVKGLCTRTGNFII